MDKSANSGELTEVKTNYKKKLKSKIKKLKFLILNKTYQKPVSFLTFLEFVKVLIFILIIIGIFYMFLLPKGQ